MYNTKNSGVLENDIIIDQSYNDAQRCGYTSKEKAQEIQGLVHELKFITRKGIRYHEIRAGFFDNWYYVVTILVALSGASSVVALITQHAENALFASIVVTIAATLDFVVGFNKKVNTHVSLRNDYEDLLTEIEDVDVTEDYSIPAYRKLHRSKRNIAKRESTLLRALSLHCHNLVLIEDTNYESINPLGFWKTMLKQFISFSDWYLTNKDTSTSIPSPLDTVSLASNE